MQTCVLKHSNFATKQVKLYINFSLSPDDLLTEGRHVVLHLQVAWNEKVSGNAVLVTAAHAGSASLLIRSSGCGLGVTSHGGGEGCGDSNWRGAAGECVQVGSWGSLRVSRVWNQGVESCLWCVCGLKSETGFVWGFFLPPFTKRSGMNVSGSEAARAAFESVRC